MTTELLIALFAAVTSILSLALGIRKQTAEAIFAEASARKTHAEEDEIRYRTQSGLISNLLQEVALLKASVDAYKQEILEVNKKLHEMELRSRSDIVRLGEEFSKQIRQLATIVSKLVKQIEALGEKPDLAEDEVTVLENLGVKGGE